jgi:aldehyde:ferredoxin oxidoreductase
MGLRTIVVDLTNESLEWTTTSDDLVDWYLGGRGMGIRYLYDNLAPGTDPLGPDNILTMWTSPILGAGPISMVKICAVTRSPLTGTILMSLMGGYFGPELRFAGADALIFKGVASRPVYLMVQDGEAELRSAEHLWGKTTRETETVLQEELQLRKMHVASIGPAGENKVSFASIMHGGDAFGLQEPQGGCRQRAAASGDRRPGALPGHSQTHGPGI